jgi:hypothetical protein
MIKPQHERMTDLETEVRVLKAEIAKLWEAHINLQRRSSDAILAHTKFRGTR